MNNNTFYRVGVDIGGTFTDIVLLGTDGSIATKKVSSTPDDYGKGIIAGIAELLAELNITPHKIKGIAHATTVATNAILENKGAKTALITTEGFRDVLEMRRTRIPELYNLNYDKPVPLVPRRLRYEVEERVGPKGEILKPLNKSKVVEVLNNIRMNDVKSLAICLLHSYANPQHEHEIAEIARELLPNVYISCSVDILPEIREYERTSTTVINAYVGPIVKQYLSSLLSQLKAAGFNAPLQVTQSAGGIMSAEAAIEYPAHIIESGPAAGVIASVRLANLVGHPNVITLDMGGTTAKAAIIESGSVAKTTEYEVGSGINISSKLVKGGGYALKLPFIDVSEIGAGGGSLISIDKGGHLKVGPQSAGAVPGPVCYDLGGTEPTFTDAVLALGYISPEFLAGGKVRLNSQKSLHIFKNNVAKPLNKTLLEAAYGVYTIAAATMVRAVKAVSTYRGRDPRDFVLYAFGGNGPVAAIEIARSLEMKRVLIPPSTGVFSALGLLFSEIEHEFMQTYFRKSTDISIDDLNGIFTKLEERTLSALNNEGFNSHEVDIKRYVDMRYSGQSYELTIPLQGGHLGASDIKTMIDLFGQEHMKTYGHRAIEDPVDLINIKVIGRVAQSELKNYDPAAAIQAGEIKQMKKNANRMAYFGAEYGLLSTPILNRKDLINCKSTGPIIIEEYDSTSVIPPKCEATLDEWGNILIDMR